jgi:hypothetical protein
MLLAALIARPATAELTPEQAPLNQWAVGILAVDWRSGDGTPIDAFENARGALESGFIKAGFARENITNLTLKPPRFGASPMKSASAFIEFSEQADAAKAGCLFYFTGHGTVDGLVLGTEGFLTPEKLNGMINAWCGSRPTVVVLSACHTGVFVEAMSAANRLIMTAARADRTSFGCGEGIRYPFFDGCIVASLENADDFLHLSELTTQCVAETEYLLQATPPSEPQTSVGTDVDDLFVFLNFAPRAR